MTPSGFLFPLAICGCSLRLLFLRSWALPYPIWAELWGISHLHCLCLPMEQPSLPIHLPPSGSKAGLAAKHHPVVAPAAVSWWDAVQRCLLVCLLRWKSGVPAVMPAVPLGWCLVGWQLWSTLRHHDGMPAGLPSTFSHLSRHVRPSI